MKADRAAIGPETTPADASVSSDDARSATVGSDDQETSSTAVGANRPLKLVLDAQTA
jgi:hypothetical protein